MFSFARGITFWSAFVVLALVSGAAATRANGQQIALIVGNHSPSIERLAAPHPAPADQLLQMSIALNPSNRPALEALRAGQQDPASPNYRRWLKRGEFDRRFGPDPAVRAAIVQWLAAAGFTISQSKGNLWTIKFSGSVVQAEHAFGVEIVSQDDGRHFANLTDPSIPAKFAGDIGFIDGLDNLRGSGKTMGIVPGSAADQSPQSFTARNGIRAFGPSDFYTFYDETPLLSSGINGAGGGCIGLIEVSDYPNVAVTNFDNAFKLPAANITRVVAPGGNPGQNSRVGETMLDIEYSHTFAPGAPISVYLSDPATFSGNLIAATVDALNAAITEDTCTALSISIESCGFPKTYYTGALHTTYLQAAMQGQTVFVAEGDEGAAEFEVDAQTGTCVNGTSLHVNELASDPLVTAIGGTQFKPHFNSTGNDVGFVAESVWNEPQFTKEEIGSGGGGASVVWPKPSFQTTTDTPNDGARDVPDISIEAACVTPGAFSVFPDQASGNKVSCCACGTSIGAPMWAGITELILQSDGQQPMSTFTSFNTRLYQLGHMQNTAVTGIRDVTKGNNDFNNVIGFNAVPGFDLATGWGTPDVTRFVSAFIDTALVSAKLVIKPKTMELNFGKSTLKNSTSAPLALTITNASSGASGVLVSITGESTSSPFAVTHQCDKTLLPGKTCTVKVTFHPTDTAVLHTGQLMIADNVTGAPQSVVLMGTGKAHK